MTETMVLLLITLCILRGKHLEISVGCLSIVQCVGHLPIRVVYQKFLIGIMEPFTIKGCMQSIIFKNSRRLISRCNDSERYQYRWRIGTNVRRATSPNRPLSCPSRCLLRPDTEANSG